jgi:hypothetical protein
MATKPTELDELEAQLRNALRREVAPASLAQAVEARMHLVKTEQQAPYEPRLWNPVVDEPVWRTWLTDLRGLFSGRRFRL